MADALTLYDIQSNKVGNATIRAGEVFFDDPTHTWVWILDARHEPYSALPLADILERAAAARKLYALVGNVAEAAPTEVELST